MTKKEKLRPYLVRSIYRLQKLIELDVPADIIGAEVHHVFATTLAIYGPAAGSSFIQHICAQTLHLRGICGHEDCADEVDRPDLGLCEDCARLASGN